MKMSETSPGGRSRHYSVEAKKSFIISLAHAAPCEILKRGKRVQPNAANNYAPCVQKDTRAALAFQPETKERRARSRIKISPMLAT
jgi:hypothetical protein